MNDECVYRTAPATQGLLNIVRSQNAAQSTSHWLLRCQVVFTKWFFKVLSEIDFCQNLIWQFCHINRNEICTQLTTQPFGVCICSLIWLVRLYHLIPLSFKHTQHKKVSILKNAHICWQKSEYFPNKNLL